MQLTLTCLSKRHESFEVCIRHIREALENAGLVVKLIPGDVNGSSGYFVLVVATKRTSYALVYDTVINSANECGYLLEVDPNIKYTENEVIYKFQNYVQKLLINRV